jgi:hypothetical protein
LLGCPPLPPWEPVLPPVVGLRGRGPIHADGGSLCLKASEVLTGVRTCNDEGGGGGGGGRVLVAARKHSGYKGHGSARGGANHGNPSSVAKGRNGTVVGIR